MQSPIDVTTEEVLYDPELRHNPLELSYWRASTAVAAADDDEEDGGAAGSREKLVLVNTGNTARLDVVNNSSCKPREPCKERNRQQVLVPAQKMLMVMVPALSNKPRNWLRRTSSKSRDLYCVELDAKA